MSAKILIDTIQLMITSLVPVLVVALEETMRPVR